MIKVIIQLIRIFRKKYWESRLNKCGKNFTCCSGVTIRKARNIKIGNDVRIGEQSYINANGGLIIGNNVKMGPQVFIWTSNHNYYAPTRLPYDESEIERKVIICDNVWIGAKSTLIPGIKIGEGAVIAMGSVVTKEVPPCAVVGGNPAKILKFRDVETYKKLKSQQKYKEHLE